MKIVLSIVKIEINSHITSIFNIYIIGHAITNMYVRVNTNMNAGHLIFSVCIKAKPKHKTVTTIIHWAIDYFVHLKHLYGIRNHLTN